MRTQAESRRDRRIRLILRGVDSELWMFRKRASAAVSRALSTKKLLRDLRWAGAACRDGSFFAVDIRIESRTRERATFRCRSERLLLIDPEFFHHVLNWNDSSSVGIG